MHLTCLSVRKIMKIIIVPLVTRLAQINGKIEPPRRAGGSTDLAPYQRDKALLCWTTGRETYPSGNGIGISYLPQ